MFTNTEEVRSFTGYEVDGDTVHMAQAIIEMFVGRSEVRVENANDRHLLALATAYQAAYIHENRETVFKQVGAKYLASDGFRMSLDVDKGSPIIAPLAHMCVSRLSWMGTKSVTTSPYVRRPHLVHWRYD